MRKREREEAREEEKGGGRIGCSYLRLMIP